MALNHRPTLALLAASASLCSALLAGCGGGGSGGAGSADPAASTCPVDALAAAGDTVDITVWHTYTGLGLDTLESLTAEYNASQDAVKVELQSQGTLPAELHSKIDQAAPDRSLPAIVVPDDTKLRYVADSGLFLPAQACFDADPDGRALLDDIEPIVRESSSIDGTMWPVGFGAGTALLYYNRAHYEAAGLDPDSPPATIEEMIDDARAIKEAGVSAEPIAFKVTDWVFEYWLTGAGQSIVDQANGREGLAVASTLDNPTTRALLETLVAAKEDGVLKVIPSAANGDELLAMATQSSSMVLTASGATSTVAAVIEGTISAEEVQDAFGLEVPEGLKLDLDIGVGPLPGITEQGRGQVGGLVWYLTSTVPAEQQAAAWDFAKFMLGTDAQVRATLEGGAIPVRRSIAKLPEVQQAWEETLAGRWNREATGSLRLLDPDFPGPVIGPYDEVRRAVGIMMDEVLFEDGDLDEAVNRADEGTTKALEAYQADVEGS
jgi:sn-glycerol 3-phosphate transport system substrate-binding protein